MLILIEGLPGSGKSLIMTQFIYDEWKKGAKLFVNFPVCFSDENERIEYFHELSETTHLRNGIICIDEAIKLLDAQRWQGMPASFKEMVCMSRHYYLDIYTAIQAFKQIDPTMRRNIHERYICKSIIRLPWKDRVKPIFQLITITKKIRSADSEADNVKWKKQNMRLKFISRYWTKSLYDTFADLESTRYMCKIIYDKKKWIVKLYSRELVNRGRTKF